MSPRLIPLCVSVVPGAPQVSKPAILALADGTVFRGTSIGADGEAGVIADTRKRVLAFTSRFPLPYRL